jgi:two-component system response regulator VanR
LISNNGKTVSRTVLLEEVWWDEGVRGNDNKLDVYISTIRKKLDKDFIQTVKGMGYRIGM